MAAHCCDNSCGSELEWVVEEKERGELLHRALAGRPDSSSPGDGAGPRQPLLDEARLGRLLSGLSAIGTPAAGGEAPDCPFPAPPFPPFPMQPPSPPPFFDQDWRDTDSLRHYSSSWSVSCAARIQPQAIESRRFGPTEKYLRDRLYCGRRV